MEDLKVMELVEEGADLLVEEVAAEEVVKAGLNVGKVIKTVAIVGGVAAGAVIIYKVGKYFKAKKADKNAEENDEVIADDSETESTNSEE